MRNINLFNRELSLIKDENLREVVRSYMEESTPDYFWTGGASASGKHHPQFSQGEGGLVRHTKAVVMFAVELLRMNTYAYMREEYKDYVIAACILHDTIKYGLGTEIDKDEYKNHARNASIAFESWCKDILGYPVSEILLNAIISHMGQWSTDKNDRPFSPVDRCVHMADYMASRSFIDIPCIVNEYNEIANQTEDFSDLPFTM